MRRFIEDMVSAKIRGSTALSIATLTLYLLVFYPVINLLYNYMVMELYNYLMITPIVLLIIYTAIVKKTSYYPETKQFFAFISLYLAGSTLVFLSTLTQSYADQLIVLGMGLTIHSIVVFFADKQFFKKLLAMTPALLVLVPLPSSFVFDFSAHLTRLVLAFSIPLAKLFGTKLKIVETSSQLIVSVLHGDKYVQFNIAPVCSGVIGLFSVIATAPLIVFASLNGEKNLSRRIIGGVIGVALLAVLMFIANVLRLTAVFYFTSLYGLDVGYGIFHYTPEIILVIPIVLVVVKIVDRVAGGISLFNVKRENPRSDRKESAEARYEKYIALIPIILLIPLSIPLLKTTYSTPPVIFADTFNGPITLFNLTTGEKELYIPYNYMNVHIDYGGRVPEFEKELGPTTRVHVYRGFTGGGRKVLDIYVEFSQQPSGIHVWEICLWWQNITIRSIKTEVYTVPGVKYKFVVRVLRYGTRFFEGYLVYWRDKVYTDQGVEYLRVTVMINTLEGNLTRRDVELVNSLAYLVWRRGFETSYGPYAKVSGFTVNYLLSITVLSAAASTAYLVFSRIRVGRKELLERVKINRRDKK